MKYEHDYSRTDIIDYNVRVFIRYIIVYFVVAAVCIAAGISIAILRREETFGFISSILLAVCGGLLLLCAVFMVITPKNYYKCLFQLDPDTEALEHAELEFIDTGFTVKVRKSVLEFSYDIIDKMVVTKDAYVLISGKKILPIVKSDYNSAADEVGQYVGDILNQRKAMQKK